MEDAALPCAHAKHGLEILEGSDWRTLCYLEENRFRALMNEEVDNDCEEEPRVFEKCREESEQRSAEATVKHALPCGAACALFRTQTSRHYCVEPACVLLRQHTNTHCRVEFACVLLKPQTSTRCRVQAKKFCSG